ncbi:MAG: GNAT family N-acetyltransferase [Meiothermus sp.]|nr:GNAT family N-acetyltransferase [Meiothermus sp.]
MRLEFKHLSEASPADLIALMNHPKVREHMPLTKENFDAEDCQRFVEGKERLWVEHGFGPWAFYADGKFVGWGGLQPEQGEADLALVLHPEAWGMGGPIAKEVLRRAFEEFGFPSVIVLFPPTRTRIRALLRLGFVRDGEAVVGGETFLRYRLYAPTEDSNTPRETS